MLEVIGVLLFLWLMGKVSGLLFRLTWGAVKVIAILLLAALPILAAGLLCAGGMMLLVPSGLLLLILALLKGDD